MHSNVKRLDDAPFQTVTSLIFYPAWFSFEQHLNTFCVWFYNVSLNVLSIHSACRGKPPLQLVFVLKKGF
jgi:hypothetical protein